MAATNPVADGSGEPDFDRAHLDHFTMQDQSLALEVVGLFLGQLPASLARLEAARTAADWQFAAHSLKGAAAAVGARRLSEIAAGLEDAAFPESPMARDGHLKTVQAAAEAFRLAARHAFPALS